eukprot:3472608-Pleurochrysis_carterae.AAC.1
MDMLMRPHAFSFCVRLKRVGLELTLFNERYNGRAKEELEHAVPDFSWSPCMLEKLKPFGSNDQPA